MAKSAGVILACVLFLISAVSIIDGCTESPPTITAEEILQIQKEGRKAFQDGLTVNDNPYPVGDREGRYGAWQKGFAREHHGVKEDQ